MDTYTFTKASTAGKSKDEIRREIESCFTDIEVTYLAIHEGSLRIGVMVDDGISDDKVFVLDENDTLIYTAGAGWEIVW